MTFGAKTRQARPGLDCLEGRELLSVGGPPSAKAAANAAVSPTQQFRSFHYTTPDGARVDIQLYGVGTLNGTTLSPDGALNLRFSGTNQQSGIIAKVHGGSGSAPLRSVQSLTLPAGSLTGIGGSLIDIVNLKDFDLVAGGRINLTPGVHVLDLNSTAPDTQINLREVPENTTVTTTTGGTSTAGTTNAFSGPTTGGTTTGVTPVNSTGSSGTSTTTGSSTSSSSVGSTGVTGSTIGSTIISPTTTTVTVLPSTTTQNGQTLAYTYPTGGGQVLTAVGGQFVPGANIVLQNITSGSSNPQPGSPPAPPGVVIAINNVNGPARGTQLLGNAQVFGYDPTANALVRFDTVTGNPTLTIPDALPVPNAQAGVALARVDGSLVVLIDNGSEVRAFDANSGAALSEFSLSTLKASTGLVNPTRLGTFGTSTVIGDPTAGANGLGLLQPIDVARSLRTGQAVATLTAAGKPVAPYSLTRGLALTGGLSGVSGSDTLYGLGGAHFDPFEPDQYQLGLASLGTGRAVGGGGASLAEGGRNVLPDANGNLIVTNSAGASPGVSLNNALGSVGPNLALFTGQAVSSGGAKVDRVALINPLTLAIKKTIALNDPNPLSSLSGSFRPALAGAALVDVQGNTQSFKAQSAQGLVFSGEGNVNLVKIADASDTTIIGYPFGHAEIPNRSNVTIVSSTRSVGTRNGVVELTNLAPTGPLSLPTA